MTDKPLTNDMIAKRADALDVANGLPATRFTRHGALVWDYLTSMDDALTLPLAEGDAYELHVLWNGHAVACVVRTVTGTLGPWHEATSAAAAICAAWWAWMEAQADV